MIVQAARDSDIPRLENWPKPERGQVEQPVVEIPISSLSISDSPRLRGESADHVRALAAAQVDLPPILVHRRAMCVIDGVHRLRVAELRGQRTIAVQFFNGDEGDAFVLAVKSNITHGLPLSLADKKYAARRIITSHPQWSDRMIAAVTGLAAKTIAEIRKRPLALSVSPGVRVGQDGRVRPVDPTERRRAALRLIEGNPSLSLREIARIVGISPETARDVRNRMHRGENPLVRRQRVHESRNGAVRDGHGRIEGIRPSQMPSQDRMAMVQRLRADPALRFSQSGRALLRLLCLHTMSDEAWEQIIQNVPAHCREAVANLARECAYLWLHIAERVDQKKTNTA